MSGSNIDDDRRFQELTRKLDEKLFVSAPYEFSKMAEEQLEASKKDALEKMDPAIKEGNLFAASMYQSQYR